MHSGEHESLLHMLVKEKKQQRSDEDKCDSARDGHIKELSSSVR